MTTPPPSHHNHTFGRHHTVAQFRDISGDIHITSSPPPTCPPVPRQLPNPPAHFTNREAELGSLADIQQQDLETERRGLLVVSGQGGVGKTALATYFLSSVANAFPHGQLYADLQGFSPARPADPSEVLDGLLRALGVAPDVIPVGVSARAALWRSHTHHRRLAVLLDDAASAPQVRPLLPGEGPHLVLVTSRHRLPDLRSDGAHFVDLAPLEQPAAIHLLTRLLEHTPHATNTALEELAHLCAGLPLALCVAAALLLLHPHTSLDAAIRRLSQRRLHLLSTPGPEGSSVNTVLDTSYTQLSELAACLYRRLGLHPGPHFDPAAAAALAGLAPIQTEDALDELLVANLIDPIGPGRYRLHELTRDHAQATCHVKDAPAERDLAIDRLLEHYMIHAAAADLVLNPWRFRLARALFDRATQAAPFGQDRAEALRWMETELPTLAALVRLAHDSGRHMETWQTCETLRKFLILRKHFEIWASCCELGLASAQALDDPDAEAFMHMMLSCVRVSVRQLASGEAHAQEALRLWRSTGHRQGQASAYEDLAAVALAQHDTRRAITYSHKSLDLHLELGAERGAAIQRRHLADAHRIAGNHPHAHTHYQQAHAYFREIGDDYMRLRALVGMATTHLHLGETEEAHTQATEALHLAQRLTAVQEEANACLLLADIARHHGDTLTEGDHLVHAHHIYTDLGSPRAAHTRQRLTELGVNDG